MELKIRQLKAFPEYYDEMISLIEHSFGYTYAYSIAEDFAPLFSKNSDAHNLLFFNQKNQLVGHIGILKKKLCYRGHEFPVILIGGVCVSSSFRGQGNLTKMMEHALSMFEGQYLLALLWSSMTQMYEKFAFYEAGQVIQTGDKSLVAPPGFEKVDISSCSQDTWQWIKESYNKRAPHEAFLKRSRRDWDIIQEMKSVSLYVNTKTQEYFMMNKGMDLPEIIHEYTPQKILNQKLENFPVWTHPQKTNQKAIGKTLYLSFMKIGAAEILSDFLALYSKGRTQEVRFQNDVIKLEVDKQVKKLSPPQLLRSLFGPGRPLLSSEGFICFTIGGVDSV